MKIELVNGSRPTSELVMEKKLTTSSSQSNARSKSPLTSSSSASGSSFRPPSSLYSSQKHASSTSSSTSASASLATSSKTISNTAASTSTSQPTPKDTLSNRFKSVGSNKEAALHLPDTKKSPTRSKISVDTSIIHQVLFNKKQSTNTRPVTFTVKLWKRGIMTTMMMMMMTKFNFFFSLYINILHVCVTKMDFGCFKVRRIGLFDFVLFCFLLLRLFYRICMCVFVVICNILPISRKNERKKKEREIDFKSDELRKSNRKNNTTPKFID